eukprot:g4778.t1
MTSSLEDEVVRAVQIREEYVERLMELVARPSVWHKMKPELTAVLDVLKLATVEVVEAVVRWRRKSHGYPFIWNGENVLLRMSSQLNFLEERPKLREWIALPSLRRNPFLQFDTLEDASPFQVLDAPSTDRTTDIATNTSTRAAATHARIRSAVVVILEEEHLHGKIEYDIPSTARKKLMGLNASSKARQFLRRSAWSTWKQFRTLLRSQNISMNPIEMEWLVSWVGSGERKQRIDHRLLRSKVLSPRRVKRRQDESISNASAGRLMASTTGSLPKWNAMQSRTLARRMESEIVRARSEMKRLEIEIHAVESSLSNTTCNEKDGGKAMSSSDSSPLSSSPSHEVVWRRNQLYKRKIELESRRGELFDKIATAERQRRHFEATEAASEGVVRDRDIIASRVRRDLERISDVSISGRLSASDVRTLTSTSHRQNATERLEQLRRAELLRQKRAKMKERRKRRVEKEARVASERLETKRAIQRALKYKHYRETKENGGRRREKAHKEVKDAENKNAVAVVAASSRAAAMAARRALFVSRMLCRHVRAIAQDDAESEDRARICVYNTSDAKIAAIAEATGDRLRAITCVVRVYDEMNYLPMTKAPQVSSSTNVMRVDLPTSDTLRVVVIPLVPAESTLALRAWGATILGRNDDDSGNCGLRHTISIKKRDVGCDGDDATCDETGFALRLVRSLQFSFLLGDSGAVGTVPTATLQRPNDTGRVRSTGLA